MSTAPMFDPYGDQKDTEKKPRPWWATCLIGCGIVMLILVIVLAMVVYWISQNWRGLTSGQGSRVVMQMVNSSDLPPEEKREIQVQVDRVADAIRDGELSFQQMGEIFEKLVQSPLLATIIVSTADQKYIDPSDLSNEEKVEGKITLDRFVRGVIDRTIDEQSADAALRHVADKQPDGTWRMRNTVTDDQLRAFLTEAKRQADDAGVPQDPPAFDPSDEVKRVIDEVMIGPAEGGERDQPAELEDPAEIEVPVEQEETFKAEEPAEAI